ncbi:hypothetical protein HS9_00777 [Bacillus velezensis]|nr:hypothetical protein HS9_00777 [Bacillus velezensis]
MHFTIHKKALLFYACEWIQGCCYYFMAEHAGRKESFEAFS